MYPNGSRQMCFSPGWDQRDQCLSLYLWGVSVRVPIVVTVGLVDVRIDWLPKLEFSWRGLLFMFFEPNHFWIILSKLLEFGLFLVQTKSFVFTLELPPEENYTRRERLICTTIMAKTACVCFALLSMFFDVIIRAWFCQILIGWNSLSVVWEDV